MPEELWGAGNLFAIDVPNNFFGWLLLLVYLVCLIGFAYSQRADMRQQSARQWGWVALLSVVAFIASQFIPITFSSNAPNQPFITYFTLLAAIPVLLGSAVFPPVLALFVGMAAGLGQAVGETNQLFSIFHGGFTAVFAAYLLQQNYVGRVYRWLREPILVGVLSGLLATFLAGIEVFASQPQVGLLALDKALVVMRANFLPRIVEGLVAGAVIMFVLHALPNLKPNRPLVPSPTQRSLQKRLSLNYVLFTAVLIMISLGVFYMVSVTISTRLMVENMVQNGQVAVAELIRMETAVADEAPQTTTKDELRSLGLAKQANQSLSIISPNGTIEGYFPPGNSQMEEKSEIWSPQSKGLRRLWLAQPEAGAAYWGYAEDDPLSRELVVEVPGSAAFPLITITVDYADVLQQAWFIGWPLLIVMLIAVGLFYTQVHIIGRDITTPINEIVDVSRTIAAGGDWPHLQFEQRDDEIGQLQRAFSQMQRSMRKRLNELSLLLGVSHDVATSIDINQGIPAILRGALRGTGAAGARAVVPNPTGGNPLTFGEGPASAEMAVLDRVITTRKRHDSELMLSTPEDIRGTLKLDPSMELPIHALMAIPLRSHDRFQGILWLGFNQAHNIDLTERNLLSTLSSQAAVLVENSWLFSTAESGRRRLAAVLASTSDAVIVTEQTERVLLINPAAERIFGIQASQVRNRPVADVISIETLVDALTGEDERPQNLEITTDDGKIYNAIASTIFSKEGQVFGRVAVLRDITYLKEIDELKSDFVATVSHDLRSPLTFMRGYATMLPMVGELTEKQQEYVNKILGGIEQMAQLVDDLLDLGRIEAGVDMEQDEIAIRPLLQDIASEYWQHAHLAGIEIQVDVADNIPLVLGDASLIRQALTNLLGNGIKYAPNSGIMLLSATQSNGEVVIGIKDNGPGITKEDQMRLFEKFYRVKERGTEKVKGSGLGLAIVKSIAERHGGRAWVQSRRGKGTTFYISLPVKSETISAHKDALSAL